MAVLAAGCFDGMLADGGGGGTSLVLITEVGVAALEGAAAACTGLQTKLCLSTQGRTALKHHTLFSHSRAEHQSVFTHTPRFS